MTTGPMPVRNDVNQSDHELQLNVWRELAISKQMLLRAATEALKLDPECTQEELKVALEALMKKTAIADAEMVGVKKAAAASVAALEQSLAATEQKLAAALKAAEEAKAAHDGVLQQMANQRAAAAVEMQKVKERLAEREKSLKAINVALADTPANVLQKLNTLKKQKQEEADGRRQIEAALNALRTEKRQQDKTLAELQKNVATLATQYRELHASSLTLRDQFQGVATDPASVPQIPELDTKLLEAIEPPAEGDSKRPQLRAVNS
jgi:colicin import membrane protein